MLGFHRLSTVAIAFVLLGAICVPSSAQQVKALQPKYSVELFQLQVESQSLLISAEMDRAQDRNANHLEQVHIYSKDDVRPQVPKVKAIHPSFVQRSFSG